MPKNMGIIDRLFRLVLVIGILGLYVTNQISGTVALILGALAVIFFLTSLMGFCPLYLPFKLSTRRKIKTI